MIVFFFVGVNLEFEDFDFEDFEDGLYWENSSSSVLNSIPNKIINKWTF